MPTARSARIALGAALTVMAPVVLAVLLFALDRFFSRGEVLRGVSVGSVSLSGLDPDGARAALDRMSDRRPSETLTVSVREQVFRLEPDEIGLAVDLDRSVERAMGAGRDAGVWRGFTWWLSRLRSGVDLPLELSIDDDAFLEQLDAWEKTAIDDLPSPGAIRYVDEKIEPEYPRDGWVVDRVATVGALRDTRGRGRRAAVRARLGRREAPLGRDAVDAALAKARALVAKPVLLVNGEHEVDFSVGDLGRALGTRLVTEPAPALEVYFDEKAVSEKLGPLRSEIELEPRDAKFEIDDRDEVTLVPSRIGTVIDAKKVSVELLAAATGSRRGKLPIERSVRPKLETPEAEQLGILWLVSKFTTFHNCCEARVKNIHRIADLLDRRIVRPGETFSVNDEIGPRTKAKGFVMAPSIARGEMVKTVGGGISQFATTMFNAIFDGGYAVIQRQPHSYYFPRYPVAHEATLSFPSPDLIFKNDSSAGVLIRTFHGPTHITVKLFGDNGGRKTKRIVSRKFDIADPPIVYEADDTLEPDEEKVTYSGLAGWSVIATRVVTMPDGTKQEEKRKVVYQPRAREVRVHSCKIPEGEEGHTGDECPEPEEDPDAGVEAIADDPGAEPTR